MKNSRIDPVLKMSIRELHTHVQDLTDLAFRSFYSSKRLDSSLASEITQAAIQLLKIVPKSAQPSWLVELAEFNKSDFYLYENCIKLIDFIICNLREIKTSIAFPDEQGLDFDALFAEVREKEDIASTFNSLIKTLEDIISADLVDSRIVQESLEQLLVLLRRSRTGSLTSVLMTFHYGRFVLNGFKGFLSNNEHLKPFVEAFEAEYLKAEKKVF